MSRRFSFIVLVACCTSAYAHDTWLAPEPPSDTRDYWTALLTTGDEFPAMGTAAKPERVERAELITSRRRVPLVPLAATEHALPFRVVADSREDAIAVAVAVLRPTDIELSPQLVATYIRDELGGDARIRARYEAQGRWRERYTKSAKALIRWRGTAAAQIATRPHGLAYELVPQIDPTHAVAGESFRVCAWASGRPVRGDETRVHIGLVDVDGSSTWQAADADGCVRVRPRTADGYLLHSILIRPVDRGDVDWESHFASLTVRRTAVSSSPLRSTP